MKLTPLFLFISLAIAEVYPQLPSSKNQQPHITPFSLNSKIPISCIQRQIDNGEHKFDAKGEIIHSSFPKCRETGEPFTLEYDVSGVKNCTIELTDENYHLFQLYIHQDVPFSCRLPIGLNSELFVPFTLNFRGLIETSHLDIDTTMNVLIHKTAQGGVISSIGYSSGGNVSRYIIGDFMPIRFHVQWIDEYHVDGLYHYDVKVDNKSSGFIIIIGLICGVIGGVVVLVSMYGVFNRRLIKNLGYKPGFTTELGIEKRD